MVDPDAAPDLEAIFGVVAHEIRLEILRVLWEKYSDDVAFEPEPMSFSTLKDRVGVRDSGQFHYHLDKLVPRFLTRHEEGYTLTYAGGQVVGAAVSGVYSKTDTTLEPTAFEDCARSSCNGTVMLGYENGHVTAACSSCERRWTMAAPPILVEAHDAAQLPADIWRFGADQFRQLTHGFCHLCGGPVEGMLAATGETAELQSPVSAVYECSACGVLARTTAVDVVADHPAVVAALYDADADYRELPPWRLRETLGAEEHVSGDTDPTVEISMEIDGNELTIVLDEHLDVIEVIDE